MSDFTFIACSDLHITKNTPRARKDIYYSSIRRKLVWLFKLAQEHNAYIICGGDFFDSVSTHHSVIEDVIRLAVRYKIKLMTVFGQHDLRYHSYSTYKNTPLAILLAAIEGIHLDETPFINDTVVVQGASWERSIPDVIPGKINILATHRTVTEGGPLWPNHIGYDTVQRLSSVGYDVVVSGDNHASFDYVSDNACFVINSGSLVRSRIDQIHYKPRVALCTITGTKLPKIEMRWIDVPIRDVSQVFKDGEIEKQENKLSEIHAQLKMFTNDISTYAIERPDFMYNIINFNKTVTDPYTKDALEEIIFEVQHNKV